MTPITITETQVFEVLRSFLLPLVSSNTEVIKGQDNRVPEPYGSNFITMIPVLRTSRFRTIDEYFDCLFDGSITSSAGEAELHVYNVQYGTIKAGAALFGAGVLPETMIVAQTGSASFLLSKDQTLPPTARLAAGTKELYTPTELTIQLDLHGPESANACQMIVTAFRDSYSAEQFKQVGFNVFPLYSGEPKQMAFRNSEQQIEGRWVLELTLQYNAAFEVPQQFFDDTTITATEVNII